MSTKKTKAQGNYKGLDTDRSPRRNAMNLPTSTYTENTDGTLTFAPFSYDDINGNTIYFTTRSITVGSTQLTAPNYFQPVFADQCYDNGDGTYTTLLPLLQMPEYSVPTGFHADFQIVALLENASTTNETYIVGEW